MSETLLTEGAGGGETGFFVVEGRA